MQGERKIHERNVDGRGRVIIGNGASPAVILVASQIGLWRIGREPCAREAVVMSVKRSALANHQVLAGGILDKAHVNYKPPSRLDSSVPASIMKMNSSACYFGDTLTVDEAARSGRRLNTKPL